MKKEIELLLDSNRGIYIPQQFAKHYGPSLYKNNKGMGKELRDDIGALLDGPDNDDYWDAWDSLLNREYIGEDGTKFTLYQDDDLWLVPDGVTFPCKIDEPNDILPSANLQNAKK